MSRSDRPYRFRPGERITPQKLNHGLSQRPTKIQAGPGMEMTKAGGNSFTFTPIRQIGGGIGGLAITPVLVLPPVPIAGTRMVRWMKSTENPNATGDGQVWISWVGAGRWYPMGAMFTNKNGVPV